MSEAGAKALLERWAEDPAFRMQLRSDPDAAVVAIGGGLDEEQLEFLRSVDWTLSDEELEALLEEKMLC
jgi:predicted ribosomally synthesized peptide with nif11-like leader